MIFRAPLFFPCPVLSFLLAWHSVLDLHERSPDKEKERDTAFWSGTIFCFHDPPAVVFSLFNCCLIKRTMES